VAIVTYLGDTYGSGSGLVPEPFTRDRARYNEWASFIQMELDAHTLYVLRKHRDLAGIYGEAPAAVATAIGGFAKQVAVADEALRGSAHLIGSKFSAADLLLVSCLDWAAAYGLELTPGLDEYRLRIRKRPAYRAAARLNFSISAGA
jgi:glutathione S-transferase